MRNKEYWYNEPEKNSNYLWIKIFLVVGLISAACWGVTSLMLREYSPESIIDSTYYDLRNMNIVSVWAAGISFILSIALIVYEHRRASREPTKPKVL